MWDPQQYGKFAQQRSRPFFDLMAQVAIEPRRVVDLGCGPGTLTAGLAERWPRATVLGVDSSPEMIHAASALSEPSRLEFVLGDIAEWEPDGDVDLVVSNAALQWVPGHRRQLGRLAGYLAPGGVLAFQVPGNFREPSHRLLHQLQTSARWRDRLQSAADRSAAVDEPSDYLDELLAAGLGAEVWETTYLQLLSGEDAVLEWMRGTALRPVLARLGQVEAEEFCAELGALLRDAYPPTSYGTVLAFRRIFAVARRPTAPRSVPCLA